MRKSQHGFSLIELLGALAIGAIMLVGLTAIVDSSLDDSKGQQAALYQSQIVNAAAQYIQTNYNTLLAGASTSVPTTITLAQLTAVAPGGPYLSSNIAPTNIYQQTPCVLVLKNASTNRLDALVVTIGGQAIPDLDGPSIAANSGPGGGFISGTTTPTAQGATWSLSDLSSYQSAPFGNCQASAGPGALADGHLASELFNDSISATGNDFLYRDQFTGQPTLNTMNTPILFSTGLAATVVENAPCTNIGGVSTDSNGLVFSCQATGWQPTQGHWKDPQADYLTLNTLPAGNNSLGDVRMDEADGRAFMWDGTSWFPLGVDQNGDLTMSGTLNANNAQILQTVSAKNVQISDVETVGTGPCTAGMVAHDANGILLSCQGGVWNNQFAFTAVNQPGCSVILFSTATTDPRCSTIYGGAYNYDSSVDTTYATINQTVTPTRNGILSLSFSAQMNRGDANCPSPDPCPNGQIEITATVIDNDTNAVVGTASAQSIQFTNNSAGINTALTQAVPVNTTGYTVQLQVGWSLFTGAIGIYHSSTEQVQGGGVIDLTPIDAVWTISLLD